jgi:hypothetical protein
MGTRSQVAAGNTSLCKHGLGCDQLATWTWVEAGRENHYCFACLLDALADVIPQRAMTTISATAPARGRMGRVVIDGGR